MSPALHLICSAKLACRLKTSTPQRTRSDNRSTKTQIASTSSGAWLASRTSVERTRTWSGSTPDSWGLCSPMLAILQAVAVGRNTDRPTRRELRHHTFGLLPHSSDVVQRQPSPEKRRSGDRYGYSEAR